MTAPSCETCGGPAYNVNRHGESTGKHRSLDECLREITRRLKALEAQQEKRS